MKQEAVFNNIGTRIYEEIIKSSESIYLAVAWISNEIIFNALLQRAREGCKILMVIQNDHINNNSKLNFSNIRNENFQIFMVEKMHNKFCVIDNKKVITGSYNWSYNAESNFENILIVSCNEIAKDYLKYFIEIIRNEIPITIKHQKESHTEIIEKLELLKKYCPSKYLESINMDIEMIKSMMPDDSNKDNINSFNYQKNKYDLENLEIEKNTKNNNLVILFKKTDDPTGLKKIIVDLEFEFLNLENEKNEIDKIISNFHYRHSTELGPILLEIINLNKEKFLLNEEEINFFDKLKSPHIDNSFENTNDSLELSEDELIKLKKRYRKACKMCHPDKVSEKFKEIAGLILNKLKEAYKNNDILTVTTILEELERGVIDENSIDFKKSSEYTELEYISYLRTSIYLLEMSIKEIKESDTYKEIISIPDWDIYFNNLKNQLIIQFESLKNKK